MQSSREENNKSTQKLSKFDMRQEYVLSGLGFVLHPSIVQSLEPFRNTTDGKGKVAIVSNSITSSTGPDPDSCYSQWANLPGREDLTVDPSLNISWEDVSTRKVVSGLDPELVENFDAVAVNLIHTSIPKDEWDATLQNITAILRPGGWIQWVDWDPITARIAGQRPGTPDASHLRDLLRRYTDALQARNVGSTYRISNAFKKLGLVESDSDMYPVAPDMGLTRVVAETALEYLEVTGDVSVQEVGDIRGKIEEEIESSGPLVWYDLWCHVARKPIKSERIEA